MVNATAEGSDQDRDQVPTVEPPETKGLGWGGTRCNPETRAEFSRKGKSTGIKAALALRRAFPILSTMRPTMFDASTHERLATLGQRVLNGGHI